MPSSILGRPRILHSNSGDCILRLIKRKGINHIMPALQSIYEVLTVPLQDGSTVELKPASIKLLKAGNKELDRLGEAKTTEESLDVLLDVVIALLSKQRPELAGEDGKEIAEDLFDMDTVYKVIEVFLGVKLNDPKLIEAAMRMQEQTSAQ